MRTKFEDTFCEWNKMLTLEEKEALLQWTYERYKTINNILINGLEIDSVNKDYIDKIDSALMKFELKKSFNVYRIEGRKNKIDELFKRFLKLKKMTLPYKNFVATSFSLDSSMKFLDDLRIDKNYNSYLFFNSILELGIHCGYLSKDLSVFSEENEILLMRDIVFKIEEVLLKFSDTVELNGKFDRFSYGL